MQDFQAVHQVAAKAPLLQGVGQRQVGRCDEPHVGVQLAGAAQRPIALVLQEAQQRDLRLGAQGVNFVEEQCATVGFGDQPAMCHLGVGKRTAFMAEQFGFEQMVGQGPAVHRHERARAAHPVVVNGARRQFFARAGFALDQHRRVARRNPSQLRQHGQKDCRRTDDLATQAGVGRADGCCSRHEGGAIAAGMEIATHRLIPPANSFEIEAGGFRVGSINSSLPTRDPCSGNAREIS